MHLCVKAAMSAGALGLRLKLAAWEAGGSSAACAASGLLS